MKLSKRQHRLWRYMIRQLKINFDPGVPVTVKTVPLKGYDGDCAGVIKLGRMIGINIRVRKNTPWKLKVETLIHEWAHAMEWSANWLNESPKKEHGETWGVWYAKIYQHLIDDCWSDMKRKGLLHPSQMNLEDEIQ